MPLPMPANTTCDIYRNNHAPPATPDVAGVACYLSADFPRRMESGEGDTTVGRYTHVMLVDISVDIRDNLVGMTISVGDHVWVPDQTGTRFEVRCVELRSRGGQFAHKRVYLDRALPPWPTNNL
jgi:hypothetical protein